jgi:hypothetical protein
MIDNIIIPAMPSYLVTGMHWIGATLGALFLLWIVACSLLKGQLFGFGVTVHREEAPLLFWVYLGLCIFYAASLLWFTWHGPITSRMFARMLSVALFLRAGIHIRFRKKSIKFNRSLFGGRGSFYFWFETIHPLGPAVFLFVFSFFLP